MYRVHLKSKTAYFRNPVTITGTQQTFECPPLSSIYGLISAAVGETIKEETVGYIFEYKYKSAEYELITKPLKLDRNKKVKGYHTKVIKNIQNASRHDILQGCHGAIPVKREILFDCDLYLYVNKKNGEAFKNPYYTLLLGRSEDLAKVVDICEIKLDKPTRNMLFGRTIIPIQHLISGVSGRICTMSITISEDIPRKVIKSGAYVLINEYFKISQFNTENVFYDSLLKKGVYIHKFDN